MIDVKEKFSDEFKGNQHLEGGVEKIEISKNSVVEKEGVGDLFSLELSQRAKSFSQPPSPHNMITIHFLIIE